MGKLLKFLLSRAIICGFMILIQLTAIMGLIWGLGQTYAKIYILLEILSFAIVIWIANGDRNPSYKLAWLLVMLPFPLFGPIFYLFFGIRHENIRSKRRRRQHKKSCNRYLAENLDVGEEIKQLDLHIHKIFKYLSNFSLYPPYRNEFCEYLSPGEKKFEKLIIELEKAEKFIFLEYFIIEEGQMWDSILKILERKAEQGVDVRVIYDDFGCLFKLPSNYFKKLKSKNIKCQVFNPLVPFINIYMNHRDHRKIAVVDNRVAFVGGTNLADEYINKNSKFGHWKDSDLMIKGEAVWSFTVMFLQNWNFFEARDDDWNKFKIGLEQKKLNKNSNPKLKQDFDQDFVEKENEIPNLTPISRQEGNMKKIIEQKNIKQDDADKDDFDGYIQPFGDMPIDYENISENVYKNLINSAQRYVYITTPYLIIDNEMLETLTFAAKSGVDVRIVCPHIPDKKSIYLVTKAFFPKLIEAGVKIYLYKPGFIHSKLIIADDQVGVVGTANMDYRSFYLHFEAGTLMYKSKTILDIKNDFMGILKKSEEISLQKSRDTNFLVRICQSILRIFSPVL